MAEALRIRVQLAIVLFVTWRPHVEMKPLRAWQSEWSQPEEFPVGNLKLDPIPKSEKRLKKEADHSRLVSGWFHKQGNLQTRLVQDSCNMSRWEAESACQCLLFFFPLQNLKSLHRGLNWIQSHLHGLNNTLLSQGYDLEAAVNSRIYFPWTGEGWGASNCPGEAWGLVNQQPHLNDFLQ